MNQSLIPLENINAVEVFTEKGIDNLLGMIKEEVNGFEADIETEKGRKECVSMAYKITLSKGVIDRAGKDLVADMKAKVKVVDDSRRRAREFLDDLAADVRRPVTEFEEAEAKRKAEEEAKRQAEEEAARLAAEIEAAHGEALLEDKVWAQEREIARLKAEEAKRQEAEAARIADEQAAKDEAERVERLRKEAQEQAAREAQEKIEAERRRAEEAEQREKDAAARAERERQEAEQREKDAAARAERERQEAVETERRRAIREQEEREAERRRIQAVEAEAERKRQADADHRKEVNRGALEALVACGFTEDDAKLFITAVYQEKVPGIRMVY